MKLIDIGEISGMSGVAPSTLRYYEELGLITSLSRHGLRRQFPPETLTRLSLISLGQSAGFSLNEISRIFGRQGEVSLPRASLQKRANEIDRQIRDLTVLRGLLLHVAACRAPSHLECPKFQSLMRAAMRQRKRSK